MSSRDAFHIKCAPDRSRVSTSTHTAPITPILPAPSCTSSRSATASRGAAATPRWSVTGIRRAAYSTGPVNTGTPMVMATWNVRHCLATGIIDDERIPRVVDRLFAPDMFSGWGIRTLSSRHPAYNPLSYHLGTVWPVENASILFGLRRYGFDARAIELAGGLLDLGQLYDFGRTPECVGGYARTEFPHPGAYPRANPVQLWNQSAYIMLIQVLLGLQPVAPLHTLAVDPVLPPWLPEITLRD